MNRDMTERNKQLQIEIDQASENLAIVRQQMNQENLRSKRIMDDLEDFPRKGRQPKAKGQSPQGQNRMPVSKSPEFVSRESESSNLGSNMMNIPDDDEVPSFGKNGQRGVAKNAKEQEMEFTQSKL